MHSDAPSLDELAQKHSTDKASGKHDFARIYESFLAPIRHAPVVMLELGVKHGASVRMWEEYFTSGRIYGVDINNGASRHSSDRIKVFEGGQADPATLQAVLSEAPRLNVVVDDGSHRYRDQYESLTQLWPHVVPGGVYIVEDTHTSYLAQYGMGFRQRPSTIELCKDLVDDIYQGLHKQTRTLPGVAAVHFFRDTVVIEKRL